MAEWNYFRFNVSRPDRIELNKEQLEACISDQMAYLLSAYGKVTLRNVDWGQTSTPVQQVELGEYDLEDGSALYLGQCPEAISSTITTPGVYALEILEPSGKTALGLAIYDSIYRRTPSVVTYEEEEPNHTVLSETADALAITRLLLKDEAANTHPINPTRFPRIRQTTTLSYCPYNGGNISFRPW